MAKPSGASTGIDGDEEFSGKEALFIDTNLDTHIALIVSVDDTVFDLKQNILSQHPKCFPDIGEIEIQAVKVKRRGHYYHLPDSMLVSSAFHGVKTNWFMVAEISSQMVGRGHAFDYEMNNHTDDRSRSLAIVFHSSSPQLVPNQVADQRLHGSNRLVGANLLLSQIKVYHNDEGNLKSCSSDTTEKSRAQRQEKFHSLIENDVVIRAHSECKEGNSKSCSTNIKCRVPAEEYLDTGCGGKKQIKRKKEGSPEHASMQNVKNGVFPLHASMQQDSVVADLMQQDSVAAELMEQDSVATDLSPIGVAPDGSFSRFGSTEKMGLELAPSSRPGEGDANLGLSNIQGMESEQNVEDQCRSMDADSRMSFLKKKGRKRRKNEAVSDHVLEVHDASLVGTGHTSQLQYGATDTFTGSVADVANLLIGNHIDDIDKRHSFDAANLSDSLAQISRDPLDGNKNLEVAIGYGDERSKKRIGNEQSNIQVAEVVQSEPVGKKKGMATNKIAVRKEAILENEYVGPSSNDEMSKQDTIARKDDFGGKELLGELINSEVLATKSIEDASLSRSSKDMAKKKRKRRASDSEDQVSLQIPSLATGAGDISDNVVENGGKEFVQNSVAPADIPTLLEDRNEVSAAFEGTSASVVNTSNRERETNSAGPAPPSVLKRMKRRKKYGDATAGSHPCTLIEEPKVFTSSETQDIVHESYDNRKDVGHAAEETASHVLEDDDANRMVHEHEQLTSNGIRLNEGVVFPVPSAGKKRKARKTMRSIADNQDLSTIETMTSVASDYPASKPDNDNLCNDVDNEENILLQIEKTSPLGDARDPDDSSRNVEVPLQILEEHKENAENNGGKSKKKRKNKKTIAASVLCDGVDVTSDDMCASKKLHHLEQHEERVGKDSEEKKTTRQKQNLTDTNSVSGIDGEANDGRQNKEVGTLLLSQIEQPDENMGKKIKKSGKRTKKHSLIASTGTHVIAGEADEMCHNEVEPVPLAKVENLAGNLETESRKPKNTSRRKLNLSAKDPSGSVLKEQENIEDGTSSGSKERELDTYKAPTKIKSARANSINRGMGSEMEAKNVEMEPQSFHPQQTDKAIVSPNSPTNAPGADSDQSPRDKGLSTMEHQINIPQKKEGSKSAIHELNFSDVLDVHQEGGAFDEWPIDFAEKEKSDKKLEDKGNRKNYGGLSSVDTSANAQSLSKSNRSRVSRKIAKDKKDESTSNSSAKYSKVAAGVIDLQPPRADATAIAPIDERNSNSSKHANLEDTNQMNDASISRVGGSDREVRQRKMQLDQYRVSYRKLSDAGIAKTVNGLEGKKTPLAKSSSLFQDASSASSEEGAAAASTNSSTRTPSDNSCSSGNSEDLSAVSWKLVGKMKNPSSGNDIELTSLLRQSRRFKEAHQLTASQTQPEEMESQDVEVVPDSEPM
ncbi:hypothetical protein Dimus_031924 [Dionaea muscipula]